MARFKSFASSWNLTIKMKSLIKYKWTVTFLGVDCCLENIWTDHSKIIVHWSWSLHCFIIFFMVFTTLSKHIHLMDCTGLQVLIMVCSIHPTKFLWHGIHYTLMSSLLWYNHAMIIWEAHDTYLLIRNSSLQGIMYGLLRLQFVITKTLLRCSPVTKWTIRWSRLYE